MTLSDCRKLFLLLLLALSIGLSGCIRGAADTSGLAGDYYLLSAEKDGILLPQTELESLDITLRLEEDGRGLLCDSDGSGRIRWSSDSSGLTLTAGNRRFAGHTEGEKLILQERNSGVAFCFCREKLDERADEFPPSTSLTGDWYGWWKTERSDGSMPESWYDCCAEISEADQGLLRLSFWDENGSRMDPLAEVFFLQHSDGSWHSAYGYFLYEEIAEDELSLPDDGAVLYMDGLHHDAEGERFDCSIYLRPWGDFWENAPAAQLPFYYSDWYLPLIRAGKDMPDEIPWEKTEQKRAA
ncbi:MAG: hypothetical protein K6C08_08280 [Oscillospiraceae bacterium]|nr:hypothetical protein [Oscillospiraceae bacterium]